MREIEVTVKEIKRRCGAKHRVGDRFYIKGKGKLELSENLSVCIYALQGLLPFLMLKQREPTPDDEWIPEISELACPDPDGVIFSIKTL